MITSTYISGDQADDRNQPFEQALKLIHKRASWLNDAYPFCVVEDEVQFVPSNSRNRYLPYLFLLLCSNRNCVPDLKDRLPDQFENLCKEALRALFPEWASILLFSQKSEDRKRHFGWAASKAVPKLAKMLNTHVINEDRLGDTQREFGIDIIAICPFEDESPYPLFAFAQCTVGQEWWEKRQEANAENGLADHVHLNTRHTNFFDDSISPTIQSTAMGA